MSLKIFIEKGKLDFKEMYFTPDCGANYSHSFGITPEEFITFAKADFFKADKRGLVNALSNAKRAIDCQVDCFVWSIGFDPEKLEKELGPNGIKSLSFGCPPTGGPLRFRFVQAMGIATPAIVGRMRQLRHLLEHEYKTPLRKNVGDAIDVAELFVQACKGKMNNVTESFSFGSGRTKARGREQVAKQFYISFKSETTPYFDVCLRDHEWISKNGVGKSPSIIVKPKDDGFMPLLKLIWRADFNAYNLMTEPLKSFFNELGIHIPSARFRVRDGDFF